MPKNFLLTEISIFGLLSVKRNSKLKITFSKLQNNTFLPTAPPSESFFSENASQNNLVTPPSILFFIPKNEK